MKSMKKTLIMCISLCLIVLVAIGGTVAYLTVDPVEKSNVFTVGEIAIKLDEVVDTVGAATVTPGENGATYVNVMPGDYLKKEVSIENTGTRPAYVAVEVTLNNANLINTAIDEFYEAKGYSESQLQEIYDYIFDGFGLNYTKVDADGNATGMRLTITGDDMPEKALQVDSVKTISEYWLQYSGNWFKDEDTVIPYDGYYTTGMNDYELRYTYYFLLEAGEKSTLFNGFNVPSAFNAEQLKMFEGLNIDINASAIQADSFIDAKDAVENMSLTEDGLKSAMTAFSVLKAEYADDGINNGSVTETVPSWDGTADTTWYNDTAVEFNLDKAEQLAGLAVLVDEGNTFEGKTIKLAANMNLYEVDENGEAMCFDPIGSYRNDTSFKGIFDGQGYTIKNLTQNTWALDNGYYYTDCGLGLFGAVENAVIKNLVMDNASVSGESAICGTVAAVAYNTTFENIKVENSDVADYQYYAGGIVGWASGEINVKDCNIDASTTVAAQWGDFDNSIGGVIGGASTNAKILIKDTIVACRIDAYNDVTSTYQWYAYRRAGMLIGNSGATAKNENGTTVATAPQLTCENVTVIYGDWANYTYCEFAGTSWPYVRVQAGVSNSAYSNPRYGHPTDANGKTVVDDDHVHNEGEDCKILCEFDQLYGGGQGVYGTAIHDGVKVIYNNR